MKTIALKLLMPFCAFALLAGFWFTLGQEAGRYVVRTLTQTGDQKGGSL